MPACAGLTMKCSLEPRILVAIMAWDRRFNAHAKRIGMVGAPSMLDS